MMAKTSENLMLQAILVDNQQRTWIALINDRLYCFDRDGKQVRFNVDGTPYDETDLTPFHSGHPHF